MAQYSEACSKFNDAAKAGDSKRLIAIISGAVGAAALGFTVIYYFVDPHAEAKAAANRTFRAQLVPWTGAGNSGLSVVGQF